VLLPQPLEPTRPTRWPGIIVQDASWRQGGGGTRSTVSRGVDWGSAESSRGVL
jgi:hypothetical protein